MAEWKNPKVIATVLTIAILFVILLASSIVFFTRIYFKRIIREKENLARTKEEHQKSLLKNSILIQERERGRIAKELHDDLISKLTVISIAFQTANQRVNLSELLDQSIKTARSLSHELLPPMLSQLSLGELIESFIDPLSDKFKLTTSFAPREDNGQLPVDVKLQLFRIAQEVINNIIKHAQASEIDILLRTTPNLTSLIIQDNGIGFPPGKQSKGLGLKNIELRAQVLNANFKYKPVKNNGTRFILIIRTNKNDSDYEKREPD